MRILNPHTGDNYPAQLSEDDHGVKITLRLKPNESLFLVDEGLIDSHRE